MFGKSARTGFIPATVISLCIAGLFSFSSDKAYMRGNSTYISIPIALMLTMVVYVFAISAFNKTGCDNLYELSEYSLGRAASKVLFLFAAAVIILFAANLENRFLILMQSCFFDNASLPALAFYFFAVPTVLALFGFGTVNRTALILGVSALIIHTILLANSYSSYESYKIYPIAGDGLKNTAVNSILYTSLFFPVAAVLLLCSLKEKRRVRTAVIAFCAAFTICVVTQLLLSLAFTYDELADLFMPLYRISMITGEENFLLRLDKTSAFVWTTCAMYTCGFLLCGATQSFRKCCNIKGAGVIPCIFGALATAICIMQSSCGGFAKVCDAALTISGVVTGVFIVYVTAASYIKHAVISKKVG